MSLARALRCLPCLILAAVLLAGCSNSDDETSESTSSDADAGIRLANATESSSLALNAVGVSEDDATVSITGITTGAVSSYQSAEAQSYTIGVSDSSGRLIAATQSQYLSADVDYTLLGYERLGAVNTYVLVDNQLEPSSGFTSLVVANATGDAGALDIYLVAPSQALGGVSPTYSSVATNSTVTAKSITSGTYDVVVTASGKPADRRLTIPSLALTSGQRLTLALTSTIGGGLLNGALLEQAGSLRLSPTTTARVRIVGAFPALADGNSVVRTTVGSVSLPAVTAPSAGSYNLVGGDTSSYAVVVDGVGVTSLPPFTFENGGDYTVLVYGTPADPTVAVFEDRNQPSSSGAANMRLVNAALQGGGISLTTDYVPVISDVEYGNASAYSPATPTSSALLQITSPVAAFPTYSASDMQLTSGSVYTLFVLGTTAAPLVIFAKDR